MLLNICLGVSRFCVFNKKEKINTITKLRETGKSFSDKPPASVHNVFKSKNIVSKYFCATLYDFG